MVKDNIEILLPAISHIVNLSLSSGTFPQQLKTAIITPLLKKDGLDPVYSNYRPVSNLTFLSKIIEKAAASSFYCHMESEYLLPKYQSAYRSGFSTETLLLKLPDDILENMEKQYITSLVAIDLSAALLENMEKQYITSLVAIDLSAAFDTVENSILLDVLKNKFGETGQAESWFTSYLKERKFVVKVNDTVSRQVVIDYSVPQGSILGPTLFSCFSSTLCDIVNERSESVLSYADDNTFLDSFKAGNITRELEVVDRMENLLLEVKGWMTSNCFLSKYILWVVFCQFNYYYYSCIFVKRN